ncbi:MAG: hypothetical protein AB1601_06340 [Planctomycetota bacterium]
MSTGDDHTGQDDATISRRRFCQTAAVGIGGLAIGGYLGARTARGQNPDPLPPPIITGRSVEICMNSRYSRHSGLSGTATTQQISNVLWAAGKAPSTGSYRTITLKTPQGTYIYHPETHSLEYSSSGTVTNAFRLNYERERDFDAGVSYVFAIWESVSLWTGTASQVANCPQMSDLNFGINSVTGLTSQLVAVSSNGSLPNPVTDGANHMEEVLADVRLRDRFRTDLDLSPQRLSQLLWAGYGCTPHMTSNSRAGLTVPSWVAEYFLTNRIYVVNDKVWRYANRVGTNLATRDHRLDLVYDADVRPALRQALPDLPAAPCYILLCLTQAGLGTWYHRLETGFAAGGILLESAALGLGCAFKAALSSAELLAVQQVTQTPVTDFAHAIVAVGHRPADLDGDGDVDADDLNAFGGCMTGPGGSVSPGCEPADADGDGDADLTDFAALQND